MNFYDLPENEQKIVAAWVDCYAPGDTCPITTRTSDMSYIFQPWANAKTDHLYQLLGNKFILKKEVEMSHSNADLEEDMQAMLNEDDIVDFRTRFIKTTLDFYSKLGSGSDYYIHHLFRADNLVANNLKTVWNAFVFEMPNGEHPLIINRAMKTMKIIGKMCTAFGIDGFEEFRQKHSQVLNQKKIKGTLCLSIHPMDFMTMSDNENGWQSCMNWREPGDYRQGTVEMMNSPNVLVAYIESNSNDLNFRYNCENYKWNSKKWRQLFYVDKNMTVGVKAYPYQSDELTNMIRDWISELGTTNMGWIYDTQDRDYNGDYIVIDGVEKGIDFNAGLMYSDFGCLPDNKKHQMRLTNVGRKMILDSDSYIEMEYSGRSECMWCGETDRVYDGNDWIDANMCICYNCGDSIRCSCCGERIPEDEAHYVGDDIYCDYCFDEWIVEDSITGELFHRDYAQNIYLSPFIEGYARYERDYCLTLADMESVNWDKYLVHGKDSICKYTINFRWGSSEVIYYINWPEVLPDAWAVLFGIEPGDYCYDRFISHEVGQFSEQR